MSKLYYIWSHNAVVYEKTLEKKQSKSEEEEEEKEEKERQRERW